MWIFSAIANAVGRNFIGRPNYLFDLLFNRVQADGGVTEAQQCTIEELTDLQNDNLLSSASLVLTPSSYKEGKLYSVIPSDGSGDMSVTRATTATRVNSDGLVELVPYNLFQYSEQFNNAYWEKGGATITSNSTTAPDGTLTADKFQEIATTDTHQIYLAYTGNIGVVTISIYAKKAERSAIQITSDQTTDPRAIFNLDTGAIHSSLNCTPFIENVGNGWYRCGITYTIDQVTSYPVFRVVDSNFDVLYTGTAGYGVYIWGAQLNEGTILPYQKTETRLNIPRLDYSKGTCPSLLVEPQRTNLALYSNALSTGTNVVDASTTTANFYVSPDGTQNAMQFTETTDNSRHGFYQYTTVTAQTYTASIFTKQTGRRYIACTSDMTGTGIAGVSYFDLQTKSVVSAGSGHTCSIEDFGNGWLRLVVTFTAMAGSRYLIWGGSPDGTNISYVGNSSISQTFYGYQLEAGAYATSYIPTTSASVTRNADYLTRSGFGNTSTSGTLFFDFYAEKIESPNGQYILNLFQGSVVNTSYPIYSSPNGLSIIANGGTIDIRNNAFSQQVQTFTPTQGQRVKIAVRYNGTNVSSAINGTLSSVFADTSVGVKNALRINNGENSTHAFNAVAFFPSYLTDDQLELLTGNSFNTYAEMASYYNYTLQ